MADVLHLPAARAGRTTRRAAGPPRSATSGREAARLAAVALSLAYERRSPWLVVELLASRSREATALQAATDLLDGVTTVDADVRRRARGLLETAAARRLSDRRRTA